MKYFLLSVILLIVLQGNAQKYVLLDKRLSQPVANSNTITSDDKYKGFFPVEKKNLKQFIQILEEIEKVLSAKGPMGTAKQYEIGCIQFRGITVPYGNGERLDYLITSTCEGIKISMHLCDAKISNADNAFFIKMWIKYIKSSG